MDAWEPCVWTKGLRGLRLAWPKDGLAIEVLEECQLDNSLVTLIKKCGFSTPNSPVDKPPYKRPPSCNDGCHPLEMTNQCLELLQNTLGTSA